jgi:hypothetical protein
MISTRGLTKPEPGHKIYPYLLRELAIERPNQVWAMDIPYIPRCTTSSLSGGGARFTGADFIEVLAGHTKPGPRDGRSTRIQRGVAVVRPDAIASFSHECGTVVKTQSRRM